MDIETLFNMLDGSIYVVCHKSERGKIPLISVWYGGGTVTVYNGRGEAIDAWTNSEPMTKPAFTKLANEHVSYSRFYLNPHCQEHGHGCEEYWCGNGGR